MFWGSSKGSGEAIGQLQILHPPVVSSDFFGRAIQPYEAHRLLGDVDRIQPAQDSTPHSSQYSFLPCPETQNNAGLLLRRLCRRNGGWKVARLLNQRRGSLPSLPLAVDREILSLLMGGSRQYVYAYSNTYELVPASYRVTLLLAKTVAARVFGSGRCFYAHAKSDVNPLPLRWDESAPWQFVLKMEEVGREGWQLLGRFRRGQESMELGASLLPLPGPFLFTPETVAPLAEDAAYAWIANLKNDQPIQIPAEDKDEFLAHPLSASEVPALELPASLRCEEVTVIPRSCLKIYRPAERYGPDKMRALLSFDYEGRAVEENTASRGFFDAAAARFLRRDREAEKSAADLLFALGMRPMAAT